MPTLRSETLQAWRQLLTFHRRVTHDLDEELRRARGVSLDEYDVLVHLAEAPEPGLRMGELAAATLLARSSCTRVVDRLVASGWVSRKEDPDDRRRMMVGLTVAGRRVLRRAAATHLKGVANRFGDRLEPRDIADLRRILERLEPG